MEGSLGMATRLVRIVLGFRSVGAGRVHIRGCCFSGFFEEESS